MKRRNPFFRFLLLLFLSVSMLSFCSSCKSEGEKLAEETIQALQEENLPNLVNCQFRYCNLSEKEKKRADEYLEEHEPNARDKIIKLLDKRLKELRFKIK